MAGRTLPFIDWRVLRHRTLLFLNGIGMALSADVDHLGLEQRLCGSRVRAVAVETACFVHQGPVDAVLAEYIIDHRAVTAAAQFEPLPFGREGRWRSGIFVALIAHPVGYGLVHIRVQDACPV